MYLTKRGLRQETAFVRPRTEKLLYALHTHRAWLHQRLVTKSKRSRAKAAANFVTHLAEEHNEKVVGDIFESVHGAEDVMRLSGEDPDTEDHRGILFALKDAAAVLKDLEVGGQEPSAVIIDDSPAEWVATAKHPIVDVPPFDRFFPGDTENLWKATPTSVAPEKLTIGGEGRRQETLLAVVAENWLQTQSGNPAPATGKRQQRASFSPREPSAFSTTADVTPIVEEAFDDDVETIALVSPLPEESTAYQPEDRHHYVSKTDSFEDVLL